MRFVRIAVAQFTGLKEPLPGGPSRKLHVGSRSELTIQMELIPDTPTAGPHPYFVTCIANVLPGATITDGTLHIDDEIRLACERSIEAFVNTLAVSHGSPREIYSYFYPYALIHESDDDKAQLATVVAYPSLLHPDLEYTFIGTAPDEHLKYVGERLEGVALMAECLSNVSALARYRECIRLFELAFQRGTAVLEKPLSSFLKSGSLGYSRAEIHEWLSHRDAAMHADQKFDNRIAFERDVRPFITRMHQAAIDVLFNKVQWHSAAPDRRNVWRPQTALMPDNGIRGTVGFPVNLPIRAMDCFYAWPVWFSLNLTKPPDWWWGTKLPMPESRPG